jgi:glycerate 2-kinase
VIGIAEVVLECAARGLAELGPRERTESVVGRALRGHGGAVRIVAVGKASAEMAEGALAALSRSTNASVRACLVVGPAGARAPHKALLASAGRVTVLRASHPLPDLRSVAAARAAMTVARAAARAAASSRGSTLIVLVSGGASSLLAWPAPGVSLDDKRAVTAALLASGVPVTDINTARRHLSRIKDGGLSRAAGDARVVTVVLSDVIGGALCDVGSGPTCPSGTTAGAARQILARHAPDFATLPLTPRARGSRRARLLEAARPEQLAEHVARQLAAEGIAARVLPASTERAAALAREYTRLAETLAPGAAIVRAAEPAVVVAGGARSARGGRCTHVAALVGASGLPRDVAFFALATDGVDGASGTGGALVVGPVAARSRALFGRAAQELDTGPAHVTLGTALPKRPSGHNLADLHVLARAPR